MSGERDTVERGSQTGSSGGPGSGRAGGPRAEASTRADGVLDRLASAPAHARGREASPHAPSGAEHISEPARLHPADVEAIARRSAELVMAAISAVPTRADGATLIDAAAVAERFGVDRGWVYAHADELGAVCLGGGSRPRLRFDPDRVLAALSPRPDSEPRPTQTPHVARSPGRRRRRTAAAGAGLLPIRDRAA